MTRSYNNSTFCLIFVFMHLLIFSLQKQDFDQKVFVATLERMEVTNYDKTHLEHIVVQTSKFNRTYTSVLFSIEPKMTIEACRMEYKVYKYNNMEYKFMGLASSVDICMALKTNSFGLSIFKTVGNFTDCPVAGNNRYVLENFGLDSNKMPPLIPEGKYKLDFFHYLNAIEKPCVEGQILVNIEYPVFGRKKKQHSS